ncbi:unnamed protein product [Paramecium primaurelia]|uniref:SET domain-containing protein n=1 Tax=Paramecium primaurelia TaxID=5886 RepID=A0A8S1NB64_PARPR|nr:unnamed protein product [Paramecium primaurelia]
MKSDYLQLFTKPSTIPNSGLGVFAKNDLTKGQILVEYRGKIINAKYSWAQCFMLEDRMLQINEKYSVIGRSLSSRFNDIVRFGLLTPMEEQSLNFGVFPIHEHLKHNVELSIKHDKAFLVASKNVKAGEELFFDYSFSYWKSFYDQMKAYKGENFFDYWEQQKQKPIPEHYIICDSDMLKLQIIDGKVYSKSTIQCGEIIIECRGKYFETEQPGRINLKLDNLFLRLNRLNNAILQNKLQSKTDLNAELVLIDKKFFIKALTIIAKGEAIFVDNNNQC